MKNSFNSYNRSNLSSNKTLEVKKEWKWFLDQIHKDLLFS